MTNQEVFANYGDSSIIVEHTIYNALFNYWEKHCRERYKQSMPPVNLVSFIKEFMREETLCEDEIFFVEKDRERKSKEEEIDVDFVEVE